MPDLEGRQGECVYIEEVTLGTKPGTAAGFALPFTSMDLSPGEGFVDFEEIDNVSYPAKPMQARHAPEGRFEFPLHWDAIGWVLKEGIGIPTTAGTDPYDHTYTLGGGNGEPEGFEIERHQEDATEKGRLFYGGRCSTLAMSMDLEGAVMFDMVAGFMRYDDWGAQTESTPTSYTSDPIDSMIGILKIGGAAVGYVAAFDWMIDWQLSLDRFPVGYGGWRYGLSRGRPRCSGSVDCFVDEDSIDALRDPEAAGTVVAFDIELVGTAVTEELKIDINSALLKITGEPVNTSGGLNMQFEWKAYGSTAFSCVLYNDVVSY